MERVEILVLCTWLLGLTKANNVSQASVGFGRVFVFVTFLHMYSCPLFIVQTLLSTTELNNSVVDYNSSRVGVVLRFQF